jgi:hypothetical protein
MTDRASAVIGVRQTCTIFVLCAAVALFRHDYLIAEAMALAAVSLPVLARLTGMRIPASTRVNFVLIAIGVMAFVWFSIAYLR